MINTQSMASVVVTLLLLGNAGSATLLWAQTSRPGRLDREVRDALRTGLHVRFHQADGQSDERVTRLAALYVDPLAAPTPFLQETAFTATLTGYFKMRLQGEHEVSFRGQGAARLFVNGQEVMAIPPGDLSAAPPATVAFVKGYNQLRIEYTSPSDPHVASQLRMYWRGDEFPWEPLPPTELFYDSREESLQGATRLREGRLLVAENHCFRCHQEPATLPSVESLADTGMPELAQHAPSLENAGLRFRRDWLVSWILDPRALHNRSTMPRLLSNDLEARQQAADIASYLLATGTTQADLAGGDRALGEQLFEDRGCIACHRFTPPAAKDDFDRVSLHFVAAKYSTASLAAFLQDPRQHFAWSRMPRIPLKENECQALAAFIHARSAGELPPVAIAGDPAKGSELFVTIGCANCHQFNSNIKPQPRIAAWTSQSLTQGCLGHHHDRAPEFPFTDAQLTAMRAFLATDLASFGRVSPAEFAERQWRVMSCRACHGRDDEEANLPYVLLEEGTQGIAPEPVPDLTWAGEKLQPAWTKRLFAGELPYRPRPHFKIRMPALPARGALLAVGLSHEHGFAVDENPQPAFQAELAQVGDQVAAMQGGLACHRCHAIGDQQATAPFEARSTNLSYATERLRYEFYHRWLRDPLRIDRNTKMIQFAQDGQRTALDTFYDGDARKQFESVWHYLLRLNQRQRARP